MIGAVLETILSNDAEKQQTGVSVIARGMSSTAGNSTDVQFSGRLLQHNLLKPSDLQAAYDLAQPATTESTKDPLAKRPSKKPTKSGSKEDDQGSAGDAYETSSSRLEDEQGVLREGNESADAGDLESDEQAGYFSVPNQAAALQLLANQRAAKASRQGNRASKLASGRHVQGGTEAAAAEGGTEAAAAAEGGTEAAAASTPATATTIEAANTLVGLVGQGQGRRAQRAVRATAKAMASYHMPKITLTAAAFDIAQSQPEHDKTTRHSLREQGPLGLAPLRKQVLPS